jgi:hypothetical protein
MFMRGKKKYLIGMAAAALVIIATVLFLPGFGGTTPPPDTVGGDIVCSGVDFEAGDFNGTGVATVADTGETALSLQSAQMQGGYVSEPQQAGYTFSALGLHWKADVPEGTRVDAEVRFSQDGSSWGDWLKVNIDDPDLPDHINSTSSAGETIGQLVFADRARFFQYRLDLKGNATGQSPAVTRLTASYIDAKGYHESPLSLARITRNVSAAVSPTQADAQPAIISRAQWGANEALMTWQPEYRPIKKIIVHHTVTSNYDPDPAATVRSIYYYHAVSLGWGDIGYNFLIDAQGRIYEGRYGGNRVVGGHALTWNYGSVGIAALGNYEEGDITGQMYNAFVELMTWKSNINQVNPLGNDYLNGAYTPNYLGHRDIGQTACPGDYMYAHLQSFRSEVYARYSPLPFYLIADASNPTGVYFVEGNIKRGVPAEVYNSWGFGRYPIDYISHESFISYATGTDLTKLIEVDGHVYFIDRGGKRGIPDANVFTIWGFDWGAITPDVLAVTRDYLPSGTDLSFLAQMEGSGSVYLVDNKTKHPLLSPDLLQHFGYPSQRDVSVVSNDYPLSTGSSIDSFTIKGSGPAKYVMSEGRKMLVPSDTILNLWSLGSSNFTVLADSTINGIASAGDLSYLGQTYGQAGVYYLEGGAQRPIVSFDTFSHWGFDQNSIFKVSPAITSAFPSGLPLTRLIGYSGSVYLMENGKKRLIDNYMSLDPDSLWRYGFSPDDVKNASAATFAIPESGDSLSLINSNLVVRGDRVYYVDGGIKHAVRDTATFDQWGFSWPDVIVPFNNSGIDSYPQGADLTLLAEHAGGVYLVQNNSFRPIFDANTFNIFKDNWGLGWGDITPVSDGVFALKSQGAPITFPRLVTYSGGGTVYYMDNDGKRPIQNAPTFIHWGFNWNEIFYTRNNAFLAGYPSPAPLSVLAVEKYSNGTLGGIFLISNGQRHPIGSYQSFINHATFDPVYNWNNIFPVSTDTLNTLTLGETIY